MTSEKEACRLCLSTEIHRLYQPLLDLEDTEHLKASLALLTDLSDITFQPAYICDQCDNVTKRFIKLKKVALKNEKLLINYQDQILTNGLKNGIETAKTNCFEERSENDNKLQTEIYEKMVFDEECESEEILKREISYSDYKEEESDENVDIKPKLSEIEQQEYCLTCDELFDDLREHETLKHSVDVSMEKCDVCGKPCGSKKLLRSHMLVHTSEMVKCPKCIPDRFLKEYVLRRHLKNCHKAADVPCEIPGCEKMFKQVEVMQRHIKSVHMLERTLCSKCGAAVINLTYHLETCNKDNLDKVTCKLCKKLFSSKMSLSLHNKSIHGPPTANEVCSVCGKAVKDMKSHMKVNHSQHNQRTICCEIEGCESMFRTKQEVTNHLNRVHLDVKAQCTICLQWLKNLPEHVSQVHQQGRKHGCTQCGKQFFKSSDLKIHIERVHQGKRYICPECGKTVSKIRDHMKAVHGISDVDKSSITTVTVNNML